MSKTVELGEMAAVADELVAKGRYASVDDVLKQAVRLVQAHEVARDDLRARVDAGIADADACRVTDVDDVEAELLAELYAEYPEAFEDDAHAA